MYVGDLVLIEIVGVINCFVLFGYCVMVDGSLGMGCGVG